MTQQKEKIKKISKVIYYLLVIGVVVFAISSVLHIAASIFVVFALPSEEALMNYVYTALPHVLYATDASIRIFEPILYDVFALAQAEMATGGLNLSLTGAIRSFVLTNTLQSLVTLGALIMASIVFKHLKNGESPFSEAVILWLKRFAFAFVILSIWTNIIYVIFALIIFAVSYIFDYGRLLQEESDTIL